MSNLTLALALSFSASVVSINPVTLREVTCSLSETYESDISFDDFLLVTSERVTVHGSAALPPIPGPRRSTRIRKPPDRYLIS